MDNDNVATALSAHIKASIALIGRVRKPAIEPIVWVKRWSIAPEKAQKTIQAATQRGIQTMIHPLLSRQFRMNDRNLCYCHLAHPVFSDTMFAGRVFRRATDVHKYMPQTLDGLQLSQWHWEVKHMRPCCCCLLGMVSHQLVFVTVPRRWYKVSSMRSSKMLHVIQNSWSHILPGQMLHKERSKSLRKGPV